MRAAWTCDGYLRLTGRIKEIINRGGEKVSPLEVDSVLMDHPAVAQCLTFAVPHPMLGEEVAAAIVPREGATLRGNGTARIRRDPPGGLQGSAPHLLPGRTSKGAHG